MLNSTSQNCPNKWKLKSPVLCGFRHCLWCCALMLTLTVGKATPILDTGNPVGSFTNVASHLLASELNVNLSRIQIYPTNQYTPAVHRLLQVAANVYDATTTNYYPSVFRPIFTNDGTNMFIIGYEQVSSVSGPADPQLALPVGVANVPVGLSTNLNVYGIPWIIGAKKGFPNFNEFAMESAFQLTRKLEVTRPSTNSPPTVYQLNQMIDLNLTNQLGVECWNSYTNNFADPVTVYVTDNQTAALTNDECFSISIPTMVSGSLQIPNGTSSNWTGYNPNSLLLPASFQIPLNANITFVPPSIYRFNEGGLPYLTSNLFLPYESNVVINGTSYPQPHWWLTTSNDVRVIIVDTAVSPYHIIDYVQLSGPDSTRDLTSEIINNYDVPVVSSEAGGGELWNTNLNQGIPIGLISQIDVSLDTFIPSPNSGSWDVSSPDTQNGIDAFRAFFHLNPIFNNPSGQEQIAVAWMTNAIQAPYTPTATVVLYVDWQVNDPLVHYLASDLNWSGALHYYQTPFSLTGANAASNLGQLNTRYAPWGGNPLLHSVDTNAYNLAIKDPLVRSSDDWNFPNWQTSNLDWIGQVHRGTPWQTIYLKSDAVDLSTWENWTGDTNDTDARWTQPTNDWQTASLLVSLLNINDLCSLLSVNNPNSNAWLAVFDGLTALTNSVPDNQLYAGSAPQFDSLTISSNSPQALVFANAIQSERSRQPDQFFHNVGDILAVPELTDQSPYLNWNDSTQQQYGISDEAYEKIPAQLLPLLRSDSVGSIVLENGQTVVRFTGYDGHAYAIEVSPDIINWLSVSTNYPVNGVLDFTNSASGAVNQRFYRSVLLQ